MNDERCRTTWTDFSERLAGVNHLCTNTDSLHGEDHACTCGARCPVVRTSVDVGRDD